MKKATAVDSPPSESTGNFIPRVTGYLVYELHSFTTAFTVAAAYLVIGIRAYIFLLRSVNPISASAA